MIEFIVSERRPPRATIAQVEVNQFFICDVNGDLCQKVDNHIYNVIARANGIPCASFQTCREDMIVRKILPKISRINFS